MANPKYFKAKNQLDYDVHVPSFSVYKLNGKIVRPEDVGIEHVEDVCSNQHNIRGYDGDPLSSPSNTDAPVFYILSDMSGKDDISAKRKDIFKDFGKDYTKFTAMLRTRKEIFYSINQAIDNAIANPNYDEPVPLLGQYDSTHTAAQIQANEQKIVEQRLHQFFYNALDSFYLDKQITLPRTTKFKDHLTHSAQAFCQHTPYLHHMAIRAVDEFCKIESPSKVPPELMNPIEVKSRFYTCIKELLIKCVGPKRDNEVLWAKYTDELERLYDFTFIEYLKSTYNKTDSEVYTVYGDSIAEVISLQFNDQSEPVSLSQGKDALLLNFHRFTAFLRWTFASLTSLDVNNQHFISDLSKKDFGSDVNESELVEKVTQNSSYKLLTDPRFKYILDEISCAFDGTFIEDSSSTTISRSLTEYVPLNTFGGKGRLQQECQYALNFVKTHSADNLNSFVDVFGGSASLVLNAMAQVGKPSDLEFFNYDYSRFHYNDLVKGLVSFMNILRHPNSVEMLIQGLSGHKIPNKLANIVPYSARFDQGTFYAAKAYTQNYSYSIPTFCRFLNSILYPKTSKNSNKPKTKYIKNDENIHAAELERYSNAVSFCLAFSFFNNTYFYGHELYDIGLYLTAVNQHLLSKQNSDNKNVTASYKLKISDIEDYRKVLFPMSSLTKKPKKSTEDKPKCDSKEIDSDDLALHTIYRVLKNAISSVKSWCKSKNVTVEYIENYLNSLDMGTSANIPLHGTRQYYDWLKEEETQNHINDILRTILPILKSKDIFDINDLIKIYELFAPVSPYNDLIQEFISNSETRKDFDQIVNSISDKLNDYADIKFNLTGVNGTDTGDEDKVEDSQDLNPDEFNESIKHLIDRLKAFYNSNKSNVSHPGYLGELNTKDSHVSKVLRDAMAEYIVLMGSFSNSRVAYSKNKYSYFTEGRFEAIRKAADVIQKVGGSGKLFTTTNLDALDFLYYELPQNALLSVDPPYVHTSRAAGATNIYITEFTAADHIKLAQWLHASSHNFVLFGKLSENEQSEATVTNYYVDPRDLMAQGYSEDDFDPSIQSLLKYSVSPQTLIKHGYAIDTIPDVTWINYSYNPDENPYRILDDLPDVLHVVYFTKNHSSNKNNKDGSDKSKPDSVEHLWIRCNACPQ